MKAKTGPPSMAAPCRLARWTASATTGSRWRSRWRASVPPARSGSPTPATWRPRSPALPRPRRRPGSGWLLLLDPEVHRHGDGRGHRLAVLDRRAEGPLPHRVAGGTVEFTRTAAAFDVDRGRVAFRIHLHPQQHRAFLACAQRGGRVVGLHLRQRLGGAVGRHGRGGSPVNGGGWRSRRFAIGRLGLFVLRGHVGGRRDRFKRHLGRIATGGEVPGDGAQCDEQDQPDQRAGAPAFGLHLLGLAFGRRAFVRRRGHGVFPVQLSREQPSTAVVVIASRSRRRGRAYGLKSKGTCTVCATGWPLRMAGSKRQRRTACSAAWSSARCELLRAISTWRGWPSVPTRTRTTTSPDAPRRSARRGYSGGGRWMGTGWLSTRTAVPASASPSPGSAVAAGGGPPATARGGSGGASGSTNTPPSRSSEGAPSASSGGRGAGSGLPCGAGSTLTAGRTAASSSPAGAGRCASHTTRNSSSPASTAAGTISQGLGARSQCGRLERDGSGESGIGIGGQGSSRFWHSGRSLGAADALGR